MNSVRASIAVLSAASAVVFTANALAENSWICVELIETHVSVEGARLQNVSDLSAVLDASARPGVLLILHCSSDRRVLEQVWESLHREGQTKGYLYADAATGSISPWLPACLRPKTPKVPLVDWNERLT